MKAIQLMEHDPPINAIVRIQKQIDSVLDDESFAKLPSDDQLQFFNKTKHRFNQLKNKEVFLERRNTDDKTELSQFQHQQEQRSEEQPSKAQEEPLVHIPRPIGINKRYQSKAEQIERYIFKVPHVLAVNDTKEFVVNGKLVTGYNLYELMSDVLRNSRSKVEGLRIAGF